MTWTRIRHTQASQATIAARANEPGIGMHALGLLVLDHEGAMQRAKRIGQEMATRK
jgi:hypothetical protein